MSRVSRVIFPIEMSVKDVCLLVETKKMQNGFQKQNVGINCGINGSYDALINVASKLKQIFLTIVHFCRKN